MAVTVDSMRGSPQRQRQLGLAGEAVQEPRRVHDFESLVKARGLLDAPASAAMSPGSASAATQFDEGPLFGKATPIRPEPAAGQRQSACDAGRTDDGRHDQAIFGDAEDSNAKDPQPRAQGGAEEVLVGFRGRTAETDRFADFVPRNPARPDVAMNVAVAGGRVALDEKSLRSVAVRRQAIGLRARYVEELGPVHVLAKKGMSGVELVVRVANMEDDQAETLERRLRRASAEEGVKVSAVRLNGAMRSAGSEGTGRG